VTFPRQAADMPSHAFYPGSDGRARYGEGLEVGYRATPGAVRPAPQFPFGYGLSYSTFSLGEPTVQIIGEAAAEQVYEVTVPVTNVSGPLGREVLQLYASSGEPSRPLLELKGFTTVDVSPGETVVATILVPISSLRSWSANKWTYWEGPVTARVGRSCADLPITIELSIATEALRSKTKGG
jgi:beta-glucosidase